MDMLEDFDGLFCYLLESSTVMFIGLDLSTAFDIIDAMFFLKNYPKKIGLQFVK